MTNKCKLCKKEYKKTSKEAYNNFKKRKYCSLDCTYQSRKGKKPDWFPKEPWNKGKKLHYDVFNKGKKWDEYMSEEGKQRIIEAARKQKGDKHPNWKGGRIHWARKEVMKRDDFTCRHCGLREPDIMELAHIKPVKGRYNRFYTNQDLDNLMVLCPNCHRRFDKKK